MRRLVSISATVVLAAGVSILISLTAVTQAHSQTSSDTYSQVVDNATEGRFEAPGWQTEPASPGAYGDDYSVAAPAKDTQPARFKVNIPETGEYTVYASWPASDTHNVSTRFGVSTTSGVQWTEVDQQANGGQWIKLGTYTLEAGDSWAVQVSRADYFKELVVADAIKVVEGAQEGISGTLGAMSTETMTTDRRGRDTGMDAVRSGRRFLGVRYRFNQCSVRDGFDCSCLTKRAFARLGKRLPDDPKKQYRFGRRIARSNIRPGDLLFFNEVRRPRGIDHVGIAAPRGEILHASVYHGRVVQAPRKWVMDDFVGAQRLLPAK